MSKKLQIEAPRSKSPTHHSFGLRHRLLPTADGDGALRRMRSLLWFKARTSF
jgi:hypothetical protein